MAEQRVNAAGETVEFNEESQRWEPVKGDPEPERVRVEDETPGVPEDDDTEEYDFEEDDK